MRLLPLIALLLAASVAQARPQRIVSLNLCADQFVLAIADRAQIAAVTHLAADPALSAGAARAAGLPATRGTAEEVLALAPDLLVTTPWAVPDLAALGARAPRLLILPPADDWPAIRRQMLQVAAAVGQPARGRMLVAQGDSRLAQLGRPGDGRIAAHYQRRGLLTGRGSLMADLMQRLGLVNLADRLGRADLAALPLEAMIAAGPGLLILDEGSLRGADEGSAMLRHPVLAGIPRVALPDALTLCGGPAYPRAAARLAAQISGSASSRRTDR